MLCISIFVLSLLVSHTGVISASAVDEDAQSEQFVLTLDHSNFSETISKHQFIVVEFYAPWCGHCKKLAPEYEKAAAILSSHEPPVVLAKIDANDAANKELARQYDIKGFPALKIFRNEGNSVQDYKGPREADGIVAYLKKQSGPPSTEIKSVEDVNSFDINNKIFIVGVFPELSGEEYDNFTALADKLRSEYEFGHTMDAEFLPLGVSSITEPTIRLFKPFDELFVDSKDFHVDALEKFVEETSVPIVTIFNKDPSNHPYVMKFFYSKNSKALLFLNFSSELFDSFKSKYYHVAKQYKGRGIRFLLGDLEASKGAFQYFGLKDDQVPLIIIQNNEGQKFLKPYVEPNQIESWVKEYMDGNVVPFRKSEPIPEVNDEPVKIVVADSLQDIVFNSGKNVLIEFYAPWCGHCKKLALILDEVSLSFESDADVIIAKLDATANDIPIDKFDVKGYPTLYFKSASGNLLKYVGGRTRDDLIDFIQKNRDKTLHEESVKEEL